jgi:outer membrane lipoprotein-sorting protein
MLMRHLLFTCLLSISLASPWVAFAQAPVKDPMAEAVLKRVATRYKAYKSYRLQFTRKTEDALGKLLEKQKGTLAVAGDKFRIETGDIKLYCDGKVLYTYQAKAKEVNITTYEPNPDEITPRDVFDLYKTGYKYLFSAELKTPTGLVDMIDLEPEDITKDIAKVRLVVDKKTAQLRKYIITERGTNSKSSFTLDAFEPNPTLSPSYFLFNKKAFPGVKVVDLR